MTVLLFSASFICFNHIRGGISTLANPSVRLPIIMYHHVLKNSARWGKYVISPKEFEKDVVYLKNQGYTTIDMQDLIDFFNKKNELPDKPIMLTFDDGYYSNYKYVLPILKKYDCKAVISVVGAYVDRSTEENDLNAAYAYLNWDIVKELVNSPYIEIQNHSYNMHEICERRGCSIKKGETFDQYSKQMINDIGKMQNMMEEKTGYRPTTFTYPYGFICKECNSILKDLGFVASLSCYEGVNVLTGESSELFELKRFNRASGINRVKFFKKFEK